MAPRSIPPAHTIIVSAAQAGARLDRIVADGLAAAGHDLGRKAVQRLIVAGAVTVNGRERTHPSAAMEAGYRVVCKLADTASVAPPAGPPLTEASIRYEDEWLIIVDKPAGMPTHATIDPARAHLHGELAALLARRNAAVDGAEPPYLAIHHRLDRDTTGLVLFAKDRAVNPALAAAFAEHRVLKQYLAVSRGAQRQPSWTVRDHLGRISPRNRPAQYGAVQSGGEYAETAFRVHRDLADGRLVIEARPLTGRTHQIRVHLAGVGLPIVGDRLYGGTPGPRVLLHAWRLIVPHPVRGGTFTVQCDPPADFPALGKARPVKS